MNPTVTPIPNKSFGAVVSGVDLNALTASTWQVIENAFHEYAALVFPAQFLSEPAQVEFAMRFGEIEILRPDSKAVQISNKKPDGTLYTPDDFRFQTLRGNEGWHMDSTYMPLAAKAGLLSAIELPASGGGETELADMRTGYDALDEVTQKRIADLSAYHSLYASQARAGYVVETGSGYGFHDKGAPLRPLVKTHPVTGRKSLCIGRHACQIPEMTDDDAVALLDDLLERSCQGPRVYSHSWQVGDLMVWDNRCVLHRARPYDFSETRSLQGTRIAGDPATELATTGRDERASGFKPTASNR
ncbi:MAG: TauD/TfdA family dioxygenase [Chromatiales bacterium]|jgi:alpha-ketoglutarate-dependent taurine dioxygenase|nr:TauD/TfdA family dioxygenase [Chromatiales bacterium]